MSDLVEIDMRREANTTLMLVRGEIDATSAPRLQSALDDLSHERVVVDMAAVEFIDSSGLHVMLSQALRIHDSGGALRIRNPSGCVQRLLEITGLGDIFFPAEDA